MTFRVRQLSGTVPVGRQTTFAQRVDLLAAGASSDEAIQSIVLLPIHLYDNDPHPEPWPSMGVDIAATGSSFTVYNVSGPPRDAIDFIAWYVYLLSSA